MSAPRRPGEPPPSPCVVFEDVTITYAGATRPALREASFTVPEGDLVLVTGHTGAGKSTLLGAVNGTVPHFTGGRLAGRVTVCGLDTRVARPRDLAGVVGVVGQDPAAGFVTDTVEEELAYTLEQLALPAADMRRRVEEVLDVLGIADLRQAPLADLSGGEQQRVAIGSVLTASPRLLVLDEPTSALDPVGADEVLATLTRLVHDLGLTVVVSEHRLERIIGAADRMVHVHDDGTVTVGTPQDILPAVTPAPSLVELGRWAGWDPLPLTVREARRAAAPLRRELAAVSDVVRDGVGTGVHASRADQPGQPGGGTARPARLTATGIGVRHAAVDAVGPVDLQLFDGEVVALMGRNGSGKSSLLWALQGSGPRAAGHVQVVGSAQSGLLDPVALRPHDRRALVGLVPQSAPDLLYLETVEAECRQADTEAGAAMGTTRACLELLATGIPGDRHPRDLSEGQRLALVLAVQLSARPQVLLLDEPTRGLDYTAKQALGRLLRAVADQGRAVVVATHDVEFAAATSHRVVVLAQGRTVADGPSREVLCDSPAFAPQVAKVLAPHPVLTLDQLRRMAPMLSQVAP